MREGTGLGFGSRFCIVLFDIRRVGGFVDIRFILRRVRFTNSLAFVFLRVFVVFFSRVIFVAVRALGRGVVLV